MPIYEYECSKCGRRQEAIQKLSDPPLTRCSFCKGPLRKLVSSPAIHFKGSGWYVTDYAKKGSASKDRSEESSKSSSGSESKSEGSESKSEGSESKSEPKPKGSGKKDSTK